MEKMLAIIIKIQMQFCSDCPFCSKEQQRVIVMQTFTMEKWFNLLTFWLPNFEHAETNSVFTSALLGQETKVVARAGQNNFLFPVRS